MVRVAVAGKSAAGAGTFMSGSPSSNRLNNVSSQNICELHGIYHRKVFHSETNDWHCARLECGTVIVGHCGSNVMVPGLSYRFTGAWKFNRKYSRKEFRFNGYVRDAVVTDQEIMAYGARYLYPAKIGIGSVRLRKLIAHRGAANCLVWLKSCPEEVSEVAGITLDQAKSLSEILVKLESAERTRMELLVIFAGKSFPRGTTERAIAELGACAADVIRRNPFTMMVRRWPGCSFLRCDSIYAEQGGPLDSIRRQLMAAQFFLDNRSQGSVWFSVQDFLENICDLVSADLSPGKLLSLGLRSHRLVCTSHEGRLFVALTQEATNEHVIHQHVLRLTEGK